MTFAICILEISKFLNLSFSFIVLFFFTSSNKNLTCSLLFNMILIVFYLLYLSTSLIKLRVEQLNILHISSCV